MMASFVFYLHIISLHFGIGNVDPIHSHAADFGRIGRSHEPQTLLIHHVLNVLHTLQNHPRDKTNAQKKTKKKRKKDGKGQIHTLGAGRGNFSWRIAFFLMVASAMAARTFRKCLYKKETFNKQTKAAEKNNMFTSLAHR